MVDSYCHCISDVFTIHTTGDVIILCKFKTKSLSVVYSFVKSYKES